MKQWKSEDSIPPEYSRALRGLVDAMDTGLDELEYIKDYCLEEGRYYKITRKFESKDIVAGEFWRWNQAKSRKTAEVNKADIMFYKLTPRKRKNFPSGAPTPRCKLWQFVVTPKDILEVPYKVLYCEKGISFDAPQGYNPSERISFTKMKEYPFPNPYDYGITIDDLSFLAPFMDDQQTASTLWPSVYRTPFLL